VSKQQCVLIVENELPIRRLLQVALERASYRVIEAGTRAEALQAIDAERPEIVILDLSLPDGDGMELIPLICKDERASVLVVSDQSATSVKVAALDLGATDYLTKPFDTDELLARIRVAVRSKVKGDCGQTSVTAGNLTIDLLARRITRNGVELRLTPKEFTALAELARFPGRIITHQHLLRAIWENEYERHSEHLRVLVHNIRKKLEENSKKPTIILNELGIGYRLARPCA